MNIKETNQNNKIKPIIEGGRERGKLRGGKGTDRVT